MKKKCRITRVYRVVPLYQLDEYLREIHLRVDHRHRDQMVEAISNDDVWIKNVRELCLQVGKMCPQCFSSHRLKDDTLVRKPIIVTRVLERMQLDYVELSVDRHGYGYLLTLIDCYSKKAWVRGKFLILLL